MKSPVQQKIEQLARSGKRSDKLIANFKEGYAENWHMAVSESFRSQLDIKFTSKIERLSSGTTRRKIRLWTQGPRIAFDKGNIFYDTPRGYQIWAEAIKHIKLACLVINGKPNDVKKEESPNSKKKVNKLINGFVEVEILIPNKGWTKLVKSHEMKMSQNEFVDFLIKGNFK